MANKPKSAVFTAKQWEEHQANKRKQQQIKDKLKQQTRKGTTYVAQPDAVNQTLRVVHNLPENVNVDSKVATQIIKDKDRKSLSNPANAYLDYKENQEHYDEQLEQWSQKQKAQRRFVENGQIADQILSNPRFVEESAAPMDNTIIVTPYGSTEIQTPQQQLAGLSFKNPLTPVEQALTIAPVALPLAYMVGAGGVVPLATSIWTNPISWGASMGLGYLGSEGVNSGVRLLSNNKYNSWGDMLGTTDTEKFILEFTNPGGLWGGIKGWNLGRGGDKVINTFRLGREMYKTPINTNTTEPILQQPKVIYQNEATLPTPSGISFDEAHINHKLSLNTNPMYTDPNFAKNPVTGRWDHINPRNKRGWELQKNNNGASNRFEHEGTEIDITTDPKKIISTYQGRLLEKSDPFQPATMSPLKSSKEVLTEGMNVAELIIHDEILHTMSLNPGISYEQARAAVEQAWIKDGVTIDNVLNAEGINVSFNMPQYKKFNGVYGRRGGQKLSASSAQTTIHENTHFLQRHTENNPLVSKEYNASGFRKPKNDEELYYTDQEKAAYGSNILSMLGKSEYNLTGAELKALHNHPKLFLLDSNLKQMLDMVVDYDKAAQWINQASYVLLPGLVVGSSLSE